MIDIYSYTSRAGREHNEDSMGFVHTTDGAVAVVADGLGGHQGGDVASKTAVDAFLAQPPDGDFDSREWLAQRFEDANRAILDRQSSQGNQMKSTAVVLRIDGDHAAWAHMGDSRLYYLHGSEIASVTEDHSVAFKKYRAGEILRREIATDEDQSSLLRSLGVRGEIKPEFGEASPLSVGDGFLLCSDGFWEHLQDQEILFDFCKTNNAQAWAELLLLRVIDRMKSDSDNLSILTAVIR